jgi:hypothetical protein
MAGDVHRPGGQWRAVGGAPVRRIGATWRRPLATDVMGESTPAQRSDRRSLPAPRRACPTRVRCVRRCSDVAARDVAGRARSGVPRQIQFAEQVFKRDFL